MSLRRKGKIALALLVALAFALRLGYVLANPQPTIKDDALHYDDIASNLAAGNGFSLSNQHLLEADRPADGGPGPTARRPALYPVFLSGIYAAFGKNYLLVLIIQAIMGTAACGLLFMLTRDALGSDRAALMALALAAVYPPFITYCSELLTEILFLFLTLAAFLAAYRAIVKGGLWTPVLAGAIGGLAMLCRPTALFFLVLQALLVAVAVSGAGRGRKWAGRMLPYAAAFCLVVSPWVIRNYVVFDAFIPGFTSAGYNLFMGTFPESRGLANVDPGMHPKELREELEGAGEVEANAIFTRAAIENVRDHPFEYLKLVANKTLRAWFVIERGTVWRPSPRSVAVHGGLLILAFAGIALKWGSRRIGVLLLAAGAVAFTGFHALVVSNLRYNLPAVPFAIALASAALAAIADRMGVYGGKGP